MKHYSTYQSQFIEMFNEKGYPLAMIKSFADVSTGGTPSKANSEYWNGDKPWVSAEDMKNKYVYDTLEKVTEAGYATCKIIPVDTLMYVCRGSIGVMAINKIECATNQSICRAKCHDNVCNVEFLYHALMYQRDNIKKMGTGTSFKSLNQTSFSELKIELPPYNEQMKFVSIAQQADKSKFTSLKSQFIEMFERNKYPRLSLDAISKEWAKGQVFKKDGICEDGETQCIHYGELFTKYGPIINEVVSRTSVEKKKTSKKGDILFPASDVTPNGLARCSMLPFDNVILGGDIIILRPKENYNAAYLSYAINQQTSQLLTRVNGGVVKHMSAKGLKTVEIPIPPMDKQEEYIKIAEQADKSKYIN